MAATPYTIRIRQTVDVVGTENHVGEWIVVGTRATKAAANRMFDGWVETHGWDYDVELVGKPGGFHRYHEHSDPNVPTLVGTEA